MVKTNSNRRQMTTSERMVSDFFASKYGAHYAAGLGALALVSTIGAYVVLKPTTKVVEANPVQAVQNAAANTSNVKDSLFSTVTSIAGVELGQNNVAKNTSNTQVVVVPQAQAPVAVANNGANTPLEARLDTLEKQTKDTLAFIGVPLEKKYYVDFNGDGHKDELIPYSRAGFIVNLSTGIFKKDEKGKVLLDKNSEAVGDYTKGSDSYTTERMHDTIKDYFFGTEKYLNEKQVKIAYNNSPGTLCYILEAAKDYNLWTKGEGGTNKLFKDAYIRIAREIEQDAGKKIICPNANFAELQN